MPSLEIIDIVQDGIDFLIVVQPEDSARGDFLMYLSFVSCSHRVNPKLQLVHGVCS